MRKIVVAILVAVIALALVGCDEPKQAQSDSGVKKASVKVNTGADGLTTEQRNISDRLTVDNKLGSIKHLYVISAYSGQVIIYSTVRGKVTSSGKRLTPSQVGDRVLPGFGEYNMSANINGVDYYTHEVLQDDGTYGTSAEYIGGGVKESEKYQKSNIKSNIKNVNCKILIQYFFREATCL